MKIKPACILVSIQIRQAQWTLVPDGDTPPRITALGRLLSTNQSLCGFKSFGVGVTPALLQQIDLHMLINSTTAYAQGND